MKPVLLLAFLALGPALAEQFPLLPPRLAPASADVLAQRSDALPTPPPNGDWAQLCGR